METMGPESVGRRVTSTWPRSVPHQAGTDLQLLDIERANTALPEAQRRALLRVCLGGRRHTQAAMLLGVPVGTVHSPLGRARDTLRHLLYPPRVNGVAA